MPIFIVALAMPMVVTNRPIPAFGRAKTCPRHDRIFDRRPSGRPRGTPSSSGTAILHARSGFHAVCIDGAEGSYPEFPFRRPERCA